MAVPAVEASHLQPQSSTQGAGCNRCAVAMRGVVPQRGSLRVWQPEPWSRAGSLAPGQAARARDSDALVNGSRPLPGRGATH